MKKIGKNKMHNYEQLFYFTLKETTKIKKNGEIDVNMNG